MSGWPTYATLKGESSCAQTSLLTFLKPYNSAVPDTTILQKTNSVEGQRGLKNHLCKVLCDQAIFFTQMYLSLKPMLIVLPYNKDEVDPTGTQVKFISIDLLFGLHFILTSSR